MKKINIASYAVVLGCLLLGHSLANAFQLASLSSSTRSRLSRLAMSSDYDYEETTSTTKRRRVRPVRRSNPLAQKAELDRKEAKARHEQALQDPTLLTKAKFQERNDLHPATKRALTETMGLQSMTEIQAKTYAQALVGKSILARSRTGTGKTLAFLVPALERILVNEQRLYHPGRNVGILIVAPTRELALQIAETAKQLLTFHETSSNDLGVLCLYGGTRIQKDIGLLNQNVPTLLVCTPGRLKDHLEGTRLRGRKFSDLVAETSILVIDEMDAALQSFPREMKKILSYLPRNEKRQTLLFSATLPKKLTPVFRSVLPKDYALVDCVAGSNNDNDDNHKSNHNKKQLPQSKGETNVRVKQSYVVLDSMDSFVEANVATVLYFMEREKSQKVMVFLPTARLVQFFHELFQLGSQKRRSVRAFQMHSKMSQSARNRVREAFRTTKTGVLFTTDVSARGLDYPDVSVVVQYGYPKTWEGYVHRLGRTGRAGNEGQGLLVLFPFEDKATKTVRRRGLDRNAKIDSLIQDLPNNKDIDTVLEPARLLVAKGDRVLTPAAETAYLSLLAYYAERASALALSGDDVLRLAKSFAAAAGLRNLPELSASLLKDLKLAAEATNIQSAE